MNSSTESILLGPFHMFTDPAERVWWPALIGALVIAFVYELLRTRGAVLKSLEAVLPMHTVFHRSSLLDVQMMFVRTATKVCIVAFIPIGAQWIAVKTVLVGYEVFTNQVPDTS